MSNSFQELLKTKGLYAQTETPLIHSDMNGSFGLSSAQKSMWFLQQLDPFSAVYNNPSAVRVKGQINLDILQEAICRLANRHEITGANFTVQNGVPVQYISPKYFTIVKYKGTEFNLVSPEGYSERLQKTINKIARSPFNLEKDPLLSVSIIQIEDTDNVLIFNIHHLISDGWSKGIILKEIAHHYHAILNNKEASLPPITIQYYDYIRWQDEYHKSNEFKIKLNFWKQRLKDAPPKLSLPTDNPRPVIQSYNGSLILFQIEDDLSSKIAKYCKTEKISIYCFLFGIFIIMLHKYTSEDDISVGTPIAGRRRVEFENLIGLFVNTLVIRTKIDNNLSFGDYIHNFKKELFQAFNNQEVPFEILVEELNPKREMSISPLYQVMFQYDNELLQSTVIDNLELLPLQLDTGISQFDLSVSCWNEKGIIKGTFEYNTDLFHKATVERMKGHYIQLINSVLATPTERINNMSLLTDEDENRILYKYNDTSYDLPINISLSYLFDNIVNTHPDNVAIETNNEKVTYKELKIQSDYLISKLIEIDIKPGNNIAILTENIIEIIVGILASIQTGAIFSIIDPEYPDERVKTIIDELKNPIVLLNRKCTTALSNTKTKFRIHFSDIYNNDNIKGNNRILATSQPLCIIFTSGSTGQPKGAILSHLNLINLYYSFKLSYDVTENDKLLPITSISSASFIGEIFPILLSGGTLVMADVNTSLNTNKFIEYLDKKKVTILSTVPSFINRLNLSGKEPSSLRLLLSGGEQLLPAHINNIPPNIKLVNGYGLTESGICNTYIELDRSSTDERLISLGKPIINNQIYVLNKNMQCVPEGVKGDIYVSGKSIGLGYWNNEALTKERFLDHPFISGERMLKTGDTGYWLFGGELCFTGRSDNQVQIRGFRVELCEIEKKLSLHPKINEVIATTRENNASETKLVAYYTTYNLQIVSSSELKEWLGEILPGYMIPDFLIQLDRLPYNFNGKIELSMLPDPIVEIESKSEYEIPQTTTENEIAAVWSEVLQITRIDVKDNFFDLGGNSLLLAKVFDHLKDKFESELTILDLFKYPTIRKLARFIENNTDSSASFESINERAMKKFNSFQKFAKDKSLRN